ncbi:MAG TPA: cytochrome c biogenesis protein CcsA [Tepidisphaeraceae bacterium]|nr:cytochrome c biogenesis protein CcsA [Tepidisphaeraceae bacterium]
MNKRISSAAPWALMVMACVFGLGAAAARAEDFADEIDLSPLRTLAVQHNDTMKTLDTFARQAIWQMTGHEKLDGHEAVYTLLDMSFHPDEYVNRDIIKIVNVPLREEFENLDSIDDQEKQRIIKQGTVSLAFLERPEVDALLVKVQASSVAKSKAINQVMGARATMEEICQLEWGFIPAAIVPPAESGGDGLWHRPIEMIGAVPALADILKQHGTAPQTPPQGYEDKQQILSSMFGATGGLMRGWDDHDASVFNESAQNLANLMQQMNPAAYPSHAKRAVEVIYNRLTMLTIPGAIFYFVAFVLFLMSAQAGVPKLHSWALAFMVIGLIVHSTGIGIRWWLVGGIFPPIKNEFESVMCSAWFGAVVGLALELRKPRGFFGAAASFVGMLSLVAIFAAPYVTDRQIGGEIGQVQGILMSYWLYIHVTMVTASYSLIGMGFLLSTWWLVRYYTGGKAVMAASPSTAPGRTFMSTLDLCNLTVLQLAFWMLGAGIIFGAIWADQSWGRPWGWDPKETFALVTWMVYLIAVHVRVVTVNKAWWTALLGFAGFWIMLFNWIGVNFLLVGLHSYA